MTTTRFAVINAATGSIANAGITYEIEAHADIAALDLSTTYPAMHFTVAEVTYDAVPVVFPIL